MPSAAAAADFSADIAIARQALARDEAALKAVDAMVVDAGRSLGRYQRAVNVAEVLQNVRTKLLVAEGASAGGKLGDYTGRGPLGAFVRVVAVRTALDMLRAAQRAPNMDGIGELDRVASTTDPEVQLLRGRYAAEFKSACEQALRELPTEDRAMFRLRMVDGLSADAIGTMLGLHRATVTRRVADCRASVNARTLELLRERLRLTPSEAKSIVAAVESAADLSLVGALAS